MLAYDSLLPVGVRTHDPLATVAEWLAQRTGQHWNARRLLEPGSWRQSQIDIRPALLRLSDQTV